MRKATPDPSLQGKGVNTPAAKTNEKSSSSSFSQGGNGSRKLTFKEKREFEQLEKEIAALEAEKKQIETELCSGTLSVDELTTKSKRLPELNDELDEKSMRWLELAEIEN